MLNILYLDQYQSMTEGLEQGRPVEELVAHARRTLFTHDVVLRCLEPIAEALSLYAEHDLTPSASSVDSQILNWAVLLFTDRTGLPKVSRADPLPWPGERLDRLRTEVDGRLDRFLTEARLSVPGVDRKASLLASPFETAESYLAGYLFLRALQRSKTEHDVRFHQGCLVLMLVRRLFFEDYALVDVLLDTLDSKHGMADLGGHVTQVITHRVRDLLAGDLTAMLDHLLHERPEAGPLPSGRSSTLEDGSSLEQRWNRGPRRLGEHLMAIASGPDRYAKLAALCLVQREVSLLYESRYPCKTEAGLLLPDDDEPREYPSVTSDMVGLPPDGGRAMAYVEVLVFPSRGDVTMAHYVNDRLVQSKPLPPAVGTDSDDVRFAIQTRIAARRAQEELLAAWSGIRAALNRDLESAAYLEAASQIAQGLCRRNFLQTALKILTAHSSDGPESILTARSFLDIFGPRDLRKVAALTLLGRSAIGRDNIERLFASVGSQYGESRKLDEFESQLLSGESQSIGGRVAAWVDEDMLWSWF